MRDWLLDIKEKGAGIWFPPLFVYPNFCNSVSCKTMCNSLRENVSVLIKNNEFFCAAVYKNFYFYTVSNLKLYGDEKIRSNYGCSGCSSRFVGLRIIKRQLPRLLAEQRTTNRTNRTALNKKPLNEVFYLICESYNRTPGLAQVRFCCLRS